MANQRNTSMTAISISLDKTLLGMVDSARLNSRSRQDRSAFIREALAEKMRSMGLEVPEDLLFPPELRSSSLNETSDSPPLEAAQPAKQVSYREDLKKTRKPRNP